MNLKRIPAAMLVAGLMSLVLPQVVQASEMDELKAMVQQLRAEVTQLKEQQNKAAAIQAVVPAGAQAATSASVGSAQGPLSINVGGGTVSLYGNIDEYLNVMKSSSGGRINSLQDGAFLRSRLGFKGDRAVADGYTVKFQLEQGLNLTNGAAADPAGADTTNGLTTSGRMFDRQAWAGIATPYGEFRAGRQNAAIQARGDYIDFTTRTLGSVVNNFGVPSRYDGDLSWISPRVNGFLAEVHYAIAGSNPVKGTATTASTVSVTNMGVYQLALDYLNGPYRVGYAGIVGRPASGTTYDRNVVYHNAYANYDYGRGKIYATVVRSNNGGAANGSGALNNLGGNIVSNNPTSTAAGAGALVSGTDATVNDFYNIWQISADYKITDKLRVGGLYGKISGPSGQLKGANGWSLGAYYDIFQNTMIYALVDSISNETFGAWGPGGSAGLTKKFSGTDLTGQKIDGIQTGFVFKF